MRDIAQTTETRPMDALVAGVVVTLTVVPFVVSLGALVFSGPLVGHVGIGVGLALFSRVVLGLVGERLSGQPGQVLNVQDKTAVILAGAVGVAANEVIARSPGLDPLPTVLVLMAIATLVTGAALWTLGRLRLGRLARYIPFPVVAGFLGGTGCVLILGAIEVMALKPFAIGTHLAPDVLVRWLPGLLFGGFLTWWSERRASKLAVPQALLIGAGVFVAMMAASGSSPATAMAGGWLLGPLPDGGLWPPPVPSPSAVDWTALLHALPNLGPLAIVAVLGLLLNISSAEAVTDVEYDLDRELRATGVANLTAGLTAGMPGYVSVGSTILLHRMGVRSRIPALVAALASGLFLVIGAAPLAWIPRALLGGLLVHLGIDLLAHALRDARAQLPAREFALVLAILAVIVAWGFLAGVGVGLLISVALFALDSSRVDIIKQTATGTELRSNIARATRHQALLDEHGEQVRVLQLQGYIFFGSAHRLLNEVTAELASGNLVFIVADFRHVIGIDCSAATTLARLQRRLHASGVALVCTGLAPEIEQLLVRAGCDLRGEVSRVIPDLDHGLEWCEEQLLALAGASRLDVRLDDEFELLAGDATLLPRLLQYAEEIELPAGVAVFQAGDAGDGLYLIESGRLTAWLEVGDGVRRRLRSMGPGTMIGESGLYLRAPRSAAVVCDTPTRLRWISDAALERMKIAAPELIGELHRVVASMLADRLVRTTAALQRRFHVS
jgi:SulP family sulfate permease